MAETPTRDRPGFVAEEPERCHACYLLMCPHQSYFLTVERAALCAGCAGEVHAIRLAGGSKPEGRGCRLLVRRGGATVKVFPHETRHLVDALVEAARGLADRAIGAG